MSAIAAQARAPGKLFLTGEWAVLAGAPAVVAAVDRWAGVRLRCREGAGPLVVESLAEGRSVALVGEDALPDGDAGAVAAALRAAALGGLLHGQVIVDSRSFLVGERKLGLGRSAATLAAATAALLATAGRTEPADVCATALAANVLFQDGRGSGADVAAAVHGGVVEVRVAGREPRITRRTLPPGLHLLAGWTGTSAPTAPLLERFAATARRPRALAPLEALAEAAADAVADANTVAFLESVDRSTELLERLGAELGIPIVTPELARLVAAARRVGAAAKPSGAGAGDCGIALATSAAQAAAVRAAWQEAGVLPLPVQVALEGVTLG
jgi:phosphomevalonate kinase